MSATSPARTPLQIRPAKRANLKRSRLLSASRMIQDRDIQIFLALHDHKVLTTHQVQDLFFSSAKRTRERLLQLYRAEFLDRFTPHTEKGSAPNHYLLGDLGAHLVAGELGIEPTYVQRRLNRIAAMSRSQRLRHLVQSNGFFSRLAWGCRQIPDSRIEWWSEDRCAKEWGDLVRPDGFGRIDSNGRSRSFFVEIDMGTESPSRLARKLDGYREAATASDVPDLLLFHFRDESTEASARKVLSECGITTATSAAQRHREQPLGAIWLPLSAARRVPLLELPRRRLKGKTG